MTESTDVYAVLGLTPAATSDEIAHAYRVLLRRYHPDTREPGDRAQGEMLDAALQRVIAAYEVLGDAGRREAYDRRAISRALRPGKRRIETSFAPQHSPIVVGPVRRHK